MQASSDAEPFNPYTATPGDQPALEIRVGIGGGADVRVVNETVLPGLAPTDLTTHLVTLLPCSSLAPHYHPTADEMQWVMEGERAPFFLLPASLPLGERRVRVLIALNGLHGTAPDGPSLLTPARRQFAAFGY